MDNDKEIVGSCTGGAVLEPLDDALGTGNVNVGDKEVAALEEDVGTLNVLTSNSEEFLVLSGNIAVDTRCKFRFQLMSFEIMHVLVFMNYVSSVVLHVVLHYSS
ncbi:hypothetical protein L6452_27006 [Arctium lappa]|uniref:Uncharacterized protein n=1 Tax=Arctium lappa TaxID=4217 RepID=A0ACB8ZVG7_ARCLA|nr:hypothetical protein L6452_27006 [Arctium lappa]